MSLEVPFLGMTLRTPFIVGSGPWLGGGSRIQHMVKQLSKYWGGIITKTYLKDSRGSITPYLWSTPEYRGVTMQNCGPTFSDPTDEEMRGLRESCKRAHDEGLVVFASLMAFLPSEWEELVDKVQEAGVDAIELNLSCPARVESIEEKGIGYYIGQKAELTAETIQVVTHAASVPVIPKLTPNVSSIVEIARACKNAGADGLSAINTIQGIIGIDVETGIPYASDMGNRAYISGLSGPLIRPIGLRIVSDICSNVDLPVLGIGGVDDWKGAVEYVMVGATAVQICTAFMWKGYKIGEQMCSGLRNYMERKEYASLDDFRGISLKYFTTSRTRVKARAVVNQEMCNGCGVCATACGDTQYGAILMDDNMAVIDEDLCEGCGLCNVVCKRGAISYIPLQS